MSDVNPDSGLNRACETLPNPTEPHGTPERRSLAARRAPRRAAPRCAPPHVYVGGARPGRPAPTAATNAPRRARTTCGRQAVGGVRTRDRPRALRARLYPPHAQPSCQGARRGPQRDREARRGARRAESPSDHRVRRCGAPSSTEQRSRRDDRTVRGLREAAEPTSLRHGKRSVAEACASKEPRPGAVESWSRARRRQAARAHAGCREPPSLAAQERG